MPRLCDGSGVLPCDCPVSVVGDHAYTCTCRRQCEGCTACGPDAGEAERKRRDVEAWYHSRVGTAPAKAKAEKKTDQPRLF